MRNYKRGFTLIELLVVMAIIGILAALALTSFNTAQKNSRDTRRKSDLQQYRNALAAYSSNNNGLYPTVEGRTVTLGGDPNGDPGSIFYTDGSNNPIIPEYLPGQIQDPLSEQTANVNWAYIYDLYSNNFSWSLRAPLEGQGGDATYTEFWEICSDGKAGKAKLSTSNPGGRFRNICCVNPNDPSYICP